VKISFLGQPVTAFDGWVAPWLQEQLRDPHIHEVRVAVAWAKRSGLARVADDLTAFNERTGTVSSLLVGIDEGGATKQGLQLALELFDRVYIFHEPGSRTYHPKVYMASGLQTAELLVGSNNMTAGGLYANYEAALRCQLDLTNAEDHALLTQVTDWFDTLRDDNNACKPLTAELLETLINDARYNIGDEDVGRQPSQATLEDADGITTDPPTESVFSGATIIKAGMPPPLRPRLRTEGKPANRYKPDPTVPGAFLPTTNDSFTSSLRWQKKLSKADAQQPTVQRTKRTGNLKLSQAGNAIDHNTYFRNDLFGDLPWTRKDTKGGTKEEVYVTFAVSIAGIDHGPHQLKVDHASHRVAGQSNVPTWLHWGPELAQLLHTTNYTGAWVTIERRADGTYRLEIRGNEDPT